MKLKHFLLSILAIAGMTLGVSCQREDDEDMGAAELTLSETSIEFGSAEASKTIEMKATRDWQAEVSENAKDWLSITPAEGKASSKKQKIQINVMANPDKDRPGTITIKVKSGNAILGNKTINVFQTGEKGSNYITIAALRAMRDASQADTLRIPESTAIKGVVVSNKDSKNLNSAKTMYVQDETAGMQLFLIETVNYAFGDQLSIDLSGIPYILYGKAHEICNVPTENITKIGTTSVEAKAVTEEDFMANKYEGQYISLERVQVAKADLSKKWYNGTSTLANINAQFPSGSAFVIRTSKNSTFKDTEVSQGSGPVKGIAQYYDGTLQLSFTRESDFAGMTGDRFEIQSTSATIDEVIDAASGQFTVKGAVVAMSSKGFIINDGGDKNLYVYYDKASIESGIAVGSVVEVSGTYTTYGGVVELKEPTSKVISETITPKAQEPIVIAASEIDSYSCKYSSLVQIEGEYKKDGSYHNMDLGATHKGSLVDNEVANSMTTGTRYVVTGYFTGITGTYFSVLPTKTEVSTAKVFGVSTQKIEASASSTSAKFNVTGNCAWTAASDNNDFTLSAVSGTGASEITVSFTANTSTEAERVANITVSTTEEVAVKSYTVVITQAKKSASGGENIVLTFPDENSGENKVNTYKSTWTAKKGSYTWNMVNFNNNNWNSSWTYIKTGWKTEALVSSITTASAIPFPIAEVSVVYDKLGEINSHKLIVSSDAAGTADVQEIPSDATAPGTVVYRVTNPAANLFYKLVIDCKKTSANGTVQISKITYVAK